jgi:hypothetical protein
MKTFAPLNSRHSPAAVAGLQQRALQMPNGHLVAAALNHDALHRSTVGVTGGQESSSGAHSLWPFGRHAGAEKETFTVL